MTSRKVCLTIAWLVVCVNAIRSEAQVRGVYPLGMSATNSGVTPSPGFTYANAFLFYSRDELKGSPGETLGTGQQSVLMDLNSLVWVSKAEVAFLGGAVVSVSATLPIANNSLTSTVQGAINGGGGFADSYYQPIILGWRKKRNDLRAAFGFLAPTGKFKAGATDNVGSGLLDAGCFGRANFLPDEKQIHSSVRRRDVRIPYSTARNEDSSWANFGSRLFGDTGICDRA